MSTFLKRAMDLVLIVAAFAVAVTAPTIVTQFCTALVAWAVIVTVAGLVIKKDKDKKEGML